MKPKGIAEQIRDIEAENERLREENEGLRSRIGKATEILGGAKVQNRTLKGSKTSSKPGNASGGATAVEKQAWYAHNNHRKQKGLGPLSLEEFLDYKNRKDSKKPDPAPKSRIESRLKLTPAERKAKAAFRVYNFNRRKKGLDPVEFDEYMTTVREPRTETPPPMAPTYVDRALAKAKTEAEKDEALREELAALNKARVKDGRVPIALDTYKRDVAMGVYRT